MISKTYWGGVARNRERLGFWFVLPTFILLMFIVIFPFFMQVYLSLTSWTPLDGESWPHAYKGFQWFEQYVNLFTDAVLWDAILRTFLIMVVVVPSEFVLGLALAYLFLDKFPLRKLFYSILLTPMMVVPAVAGLMFYLCFQGTGPINHHLGLPGSFTWLTDTTRSLIAVMIADIWQWTPLMFLILLAGMLGVPSDQILAARLLGGSNFQNFAKIILPRIKGVIVIALVLRVVECFKVFDLVYIMTKGGPGVQTQTISVYLYKLTFNDLDWSYVAAIGLTILAALSVLAAYALKLTGKPGGEA